MKIPCDIGGVIEEREESTLRKVEGEKNDDIEHTTWVEYWLNDVLVHRSVHVRLKTLPPLQGIIENLQ